MDDAGVFALGAPGGVFVGHQDGAAPFGAVGQALSDADQDEQDASPDADGLRPTCPGGIRPLPTVYAADQVGLCSDAFYYSEWLVRIVPMPTTRQPGMSRGTVVGLDSGSGTACSAVWTSSATVG